MKIYKISKEEEKQKMESFFEERTKKHIKSVQEYCKKIYDLDPKRFKKITDNAKYHDESKFKEPERYPYIYTTWQYKCKDDGVEFNPPEDLKDKMTEATEHHIKNNSHHPEFHCDKETDLINKDNRDKPPEEMIDTTKMPEIDIAEMVADWCAVSQERGNSPKTWADKNINVRWKFTEKQKELIYELIEKIF